MINSTELEYLNFKRKMVIKAAEVRDDFNKLSEQNKRRVSDEIADFLIQYNFIITAEEVLNLMNRGNSK